MHRELLDTPKDVRDVLYNVDLNAIMEHEKQLAACMQKSVMKM
jgi:hypothetical protein